ncbi:MAG: hypothetical protein J0G35_00440 [Acidobacteriales bacterium]|nr:hypothetical protein [Terriglobales bacterium]
MSSLLLAGCGGKSGSTPGPPSPPAAVLSVTAPKDGATMHGEPATISVSAANLADAGKLTVLLNGVDITSRFGAADSSGVRSVQVERPDINYGKNQVQVRYEDLRANSTFTLDTASSDGSGQAPGSSDSGVNGSSLLVPIQTRVIDAKADPAKPTSWGIQVGGTLYQSPMPVNENGEPCTQYCYGYQILMLSRQDLSLVSNNAYEVATYDEIAPDAPFMVALEAAAAGPDDPSGILGRRSGTSGCQPSGCVMVMQSLAQIGYTPCYNATANFGICPRFTSGDSHVVTLIYWLTKLGASAQTLFTNGMQSSHIGYSFIGNAGSGSMPGTGTQGNDHGEITVGGNANGQYEHLSCSDKTYQNPATICDNLEWSRIDGTAYTPTDTGVISGVLIRDNYNLFTFANNAPQITFTFANSSKNGTWSNVVSINGSTAEGMGQYSMTLPSGSRGGFRLLVLDRTQPAYYEAKRWDKFYDIDTGLTNLANDLVLGSNANGLYFLASMGDVTHDATNQSFSPLWEKLADSAVRIGADRLTFRMLGERHQSFNPDKKDDYLLVGRQIPYSPPVFENFTAGTRSTYTAAEAGYVINRRTVANATSPTSIEGVLKPDHHGYYTPRLVGPQSQMITPQIASIGSASLLVPTPWPYMSTTTEQNAYTWISNQLCCSDIRASYVNLNVSPEVWLSQLDGLSYPSSQSSSFSAAAFNDVKGQLQTEFQYVALVRNLEGNILSLYQNQQSNVGLILQEAQDAITADIYSNTPPPQPATTWSVFTNDVFPVLGDLAGFTSLGGPGADAIGIGVQTALGIGTLAIDNTAERSNDPSGISQVMHSLANEDIAASQLARHAVNEYTDSLVSLGNDFNRIVTDWGRLRTTGGPIATGQLVWDSAASGYFLRGFDLATRRQFYPALMANNQDFFITHILYSDNHYFASDDDYEYNNGDGCSISNFYSAQEHGGYKDGKDYRGTAWYPGVLQQDPGVDGQPNYPGAYWWDIWALGLGTNSNCPDPEGTSLPSTRGMFDPIVAVDDYTTNGLGLWKPYFYQYSGFRTVTHHNGYFEGHAP